MRRRGAACTRIGSDRIGAKLFDDRKDWERGQEKERRVGGSEGETRKNSISLAKWRVFRYGFTANQMISVGSAK